MVDRRSGKSLAGILRAGLPFSKFIPAVRFKDWLSELRHLARYTDAIQRIAAGERVMVLTSTPPRHGKTSVTMSAIAFLLLRHPSTRILYCTASDALAQSKSREAREFARTSGLELVSESLHEWTTREGGGVVFIGSGAVVQGRGFDVILCDDLIASGEAADSEIQRAALWGWWQSTLATRGQAGASIVVIGSRWRENDLMASLEAEGIWEVINLPAINDETGAALWPEGGFTLDELAIIKARVGARTWEAAFMGRPGSPEGNTFRRQDLVPREIPPLRNIVLSVDGAWKTGLANDYSAIATVGLVAGEAAADSSPRHNVFSLFPNLGQYPARQDAPQLEGGPARFGIRSMWRGKVELAGLLLQIVALARVHNPAAVLIENSASGLAAIQILKSTSALPVIPISVTASKVARASAVSSLFEAGRVAIGIGAWTGDLVEELCAFPHGRHDDQVDAVVMALTYLVEVERRGQRKNVAPPNLANMYGR